MAATSGDNKSAAQRAAQLRDEINGHDHRYYVLNEPAIPDAEYDRLIKELREIEAADPSLVTADSPTQRVSGSPAAEFGEVKHAIPMLSLENGFATRTLPISIARCVSGSGVLNLKGPASSNTQPSPSSMVSQSRSCTATENCFAPPRAVTV
jgi:hypothetical protein